MHQIWLRFMKLQSKNFYLLLILLCITASSLFAQEKRDKQSLATIIQFLQTKHSIQFNYAEDVIKDIKLVPPKEDFSISENLEYLNKHTKLSFTITNEQFVLVLPSNSLMLCGYLKDRNTLEPLVSATIQIENDAVVSDKNGFFRLQIPESSSDIIIRFLGYENLVKPYNELRTINCETILMIPTVEALSEIVISSYIVDGITKINDGTFKIDVSKFDILPGLIDSDVLQSVQAFPGIQSSNETVSNINIRGGTHDQNLILWDGIKMYQSGHFFGLISMYNPQITQQVSLHKNGSTVSYTDGVSGTIAMETSSKVNPEFNGSIGVNLIDANAFVDIPVGIKSSIQIAGRKGLSDFAKTPMYDAFFDRIAQDTEVETNDNTVVNSDEGFDFYDTSLRWIYEISDTDKLQLNFINVSNNLRFDEQSILNTTQASRESSVTQNSIAGALHYRRQWNAKFSTSFEAYETDYKLKAINANVIDQQRFLQENKVSETSIKLITDYELNNKLSLLNGYHFVETEVTNLDDVDRPLFRLLISEVVRTHAVFSQVGFMSLNNKTRLNVGIRLNYLEKFDKTILEPRLSFSQRFLEDFTVEILGEFKHQNTSQVINFQNDFLGIEKRRWQLSNDKDIPVIISKQLSTGLTYNKKGWLVSAEGYYKTVDGITTQSQGFQNQYEFVKAIGRYDVIGLDVLLRKKMAHLNTWLSYAYMKNNYMFSSLEDAAFPSNFDITHAITLGTAYTTKKLKLSAGLNWHSGKPTTNLVSGNEIIADELNYDETNQTTFNDYLRFDVSAVYNFSIGKRYNARIGASVWNVLNRENEINNFYRVTNGAVTETIQQSLGITPNVSFRMLW